MKFAARILVLASAFVFAAHAQFFTILTGNIDLGPTPVGAVVKRQIAVTTLGNVPPSNFLIVGQAEGPFQVIKL
ncbi:MAG TPA: hypothetical protein VEW69_12220, partial [Alphaproteobacteria bacterium]|nr:hypothetical protein [Alphaproteobacteria bacterium]